MHYWNTLLLRSSSRSASLKSVGNYLVFTGSNQRADSITLECDNNYINRRNPKVQILSYFSNDYNDDTWQCGVRSTWGRVTFLIFTRLLCVTCTEWTHRWGIVLSACFCSETTVRTSIKCEVTGELGWIKCPHPLYNFLKPTSPMFLS